ncbi:MAG: 2-hydroxycarboxylate transporter family protein, partial [Cetobacterium sp.]|nr:2-hydroxycarboxylate transporter family protein [Cetobacterium sp.]
MKNDRFKLLGLEMKYFLPITFLVIGASYLHVLPKGLVGILPYLMVVGIILDYIGNHLPIIKDYFGGGPIVIIFASAAFVYFDILPKETSKAIHTFMIQDSFLDFYIAALIVGSILGMNRSLLIRAAIKYLPVIIGGVTVALLLTGTLGMILGYGFKRAIFYIAMPIMGGGMGAGAVPLAQIFGQALKEDPKSILSVMVPAVALGNAIAIVFGGLLNNFGKKYPKFSGNGQLLKSEENNAEEDKKILTSLDYKQLGIGLIVSTTFFILGKILNIFIPIHPYALMIISVAIFKMCGFIKWEYEECAFKWFHFVMNNFTCGLLVGIGVAYTNLGQVIDAFTPTYLFLVFSTVIGAVIGTSIVGYFLNFY